MTTANKQRLQLQVKLNLRKNYAIIFFQTVTII
jgi:hypothetical protein